MSLRTQIRQRPWRQNLELRARRLAYKRRDVICEARGTRLLYVIPSCKTYPCQNVGNFSTSWGTIRFVRKVVLRKIRYSDRSLEPSRCCTLTWMERRKNWATVAGLGTKIGTCSHRNSRHACQLAKQWWMRSYSLITYNTRIFNMKCRSKQGH
jgi:hypothetical protein